MSMEPLYASAIGRRSERPVLESTEQQLAVAQRARNSDITVTLAATTAHSAHSRPYSRGRRSRGCPISPIATIRSNVAPNVSANPGSLRPRTVQRTRGRLCRSRREQARSESLAMMLPQAVVAIPALETLSASSREQTSAANSWNALPAISGPDPRVSSSSGPAAHHFKVNGNKAHRRLIGWTTGMRAVVLVRDPHASFGSVLGRIFEDQRVAVGLHSEQALCEGSPHRTDRPAAQRPHPGQSHASPLTELEPSAPTEFQHVRRS